MKKIINILSIVALISFISGFAISFNHIIANRYIQYKMFRMAAFSLQESLNKAISLTIIVSTGLFIILIIAKFIRRLFVSNAIESRSKDKSTPLVVFVGYIRRIALILVMLSVILNLGILIDREINVPKQPNIIILLIDSLRKDHLGRYGYSRPTSPNIDRFSQEAFTFQNAVSQCSWTAPSVASLFSMLYPSTHGLKVCQEKDVRNVESDVLDYKIATFAEVLKERGYLTAAFTENCFFDKRFQIVQGFEIVDLIDPKIMPPASELNKNALKWIRKNKGRPFFAYLHYMSVHSLFGPPGDFESFFISAEDRQMSAEEASKLGGISVGREIDNNNLNYYINRYDSGIRYVDYHIGHFLKKLKQYDLLNNTIVIITADHGEAFFEHGYICHGTGLYSEEIDIPLIIKFPSSIRFPDFTNYKVELIDVTATIIHILNCRFPYDTDGRDLLCVSDSRDLISHAVFSELSGSQRAKDMGVFSETAMTKDNLRAIYVAEKQKVTELYDLERDRRELNNIINLYPHKIKEIEKDIKTWQEQRLQRRKELGLRESCVSIKNKEKIKQLKSLGYAQ